MKYARVHATKSIVLSLTVAATGLLAACGRSPAGPAEGLPPYTYTQPVETGDAWETASLSDVGLDPDSLVALMNQLRAHPGHLVHGILIARHGMLVFEEYFDGYDRRAPNTLIHFDTDTPHDLASVTKSFTSALLGIAIDEGILDSVQEPVSESFPGFPWLKEPPKDALCLEHFINMASGLQWDQHSRPLLDPRNDLMLFSHSRQPWMLYLSRPLVTPPGTAMNYSEASINVVGESIARASGLSVKQFADRYLFSRMGITVSSWSIATAGFVWASGDLFLRPRDMLEFGQLYLQRGVWQGEQVVPEAWVERTREPYTRFGPQSMEHERYWLNNADMIGYKDAWWILDPESYGEGAIAANGWGGQRIFVLPAWDMVVVTTGGSQSEEPFLEPQDIMAGYVLPAIETVAG